MVNDNLRYIRWKHIKSSHPEILKTADLAELMRSGALFARKFDTDVDAGILDQIDRHCLSEIGKSEVSPSLV
jgi:hypothetical protein